MWILSVSCKNAKISRRERKIAIIIFITIATTIIIIITCTTIHMATIIIIIITGITQIMKGHGTKISIIKRATKMSKNKQRVM